ncbi:TPA: hypothetical protein SLD83_001772 [Legionella pneumophila]|jgi:hypothetical protein|uniref:Uncharacterized protein n=1 Tax=Legionella bononiensis TaxID=2793102 RepID=A0ABS1WF36_9GAMM|nr:MULTISPECIES: hypothetical protein [Legionellaceae]ERI48038.1 hypothetical protein N749_11435 [Legionella pneumophila str. Leg01/20]HAT9652198.1 hypothetical protein [Legionella pneumophila subsp. pneumophila]KTD12360.1 hypothetical protein Lhac_1231 [Legionella hackeliae]MBL7478695.1 hypothetical protein [Legionella bononiensis]MBL7527895.1 hypothetical protein [Legionella bononiensis]
MNKLKLNNNEDDKKIITFTINKEIKESLREILLNSEKYNLKKKTDWVNEAIIMLKENPDYKEMVLNAEGNSENFVFDKIYMTFKQRCFFSDMRSEVVKEYPDIRGPQTAIIRAAILSRMMRKK